MHSLELCRGRVAAYHVEGSRVSWVFSGRASRRGEVRIHVLSDVSYSARFAVTWARRAVNDERSVRVAVLVSSTAAARASYCFQLSHAEP